jgi:hypothetical protein
MDHPNAMQDMMNLALHFLATIEDYAIQNRRMKTFILSLPMAHQPGFSLDRLLAETARAGGNEQDLRERFDEVRGTILEFPRSLEKLQQLTERLERLKSMG